MKNLWVLGALFLVSVATAQERRAFPDYCRDPNYSESYSCIGAHPSYCQDSSYSNRKACILARPSYCSNPNYSNTKACAGAGPSYCADPNYSETLACISPIFDDSTLMLLLLK